MRKVETYLIIDKDGRIKKIRTDSGMKGVEASIKYLGIKDYAEIRLVPDNPGWVDGLNVGEFDAKGDLYSIEKRIIDGYRPAPKGKKVESGKLIDKTLRERIDDGEEEISEYQKYDSKTDAIIEKTQDELLIDGLITQEQIDAEEKEKKIQAELRMMAEERIEARENVGTI